MRWMILGGVLVACGGVSDLRITGGDYDGGLSPIGSGGWAATGGRIGVATGSRVGSGGSVVSGPGGSLGVADSGADSAPDSGSDGGLEPDSGAFVDAAPDRYDGQGVTGSGGLAGSGGSGSGGAGPVCPATCGAPPRNAQWTCPGCGYECNPGFLKTPGGCEIDPGAGGASGSGGAGSGGAPGSGGADNCSATCVRGFCENGACTPCPAAQLDCDHYPGNQCETFMSASNCGSCGRRCNVAESCEWDSVTASYACVR